MMTISEQLADMGGVVPGTRCVFVRQIRAPYLVGIDGRIYSRGPDGDVIDFRSDVAIVRANTVREPE